MEQLRAVGELVWTASVAGFVQRHDPLQFGGAWLLNTGRCDLLLAGVVLATGGGILLEL